MSPNILSVSCSAYQFQVGAFDWVNTAAAVKKVTTTLKRSLKTQVNSSVNI